MDLRQAIDDARQHINDPPPNESTTCDWVILPLLRVAGYALREIVSRDADAQRNFPDYTILPKEEAHTFYLEAKAWKVALEDAHAAQTLNYANANGKRWAVLTNGRAWRLYDNDIRGRAEEKLVAQASLEDPEPDGMLSFLTAIGKESVCSDGLARYAAAEKMRREEEERARKHKEEQTRRRERLAEILEGELAEEGSPLMEAVLGHLRKREGMTDLTAEDVVSCFQGGPGVSFHPLESPIPATPRVFGGESDEVVIIPAKRAWEFYCKLSAYECQHNRTFRSTTRMAFYHDGAIEKSIPRILDSVRVPRFDEESVRKEAGFSEDMRARLLNLIREMKAKGFSSWCNGKPQQITFLSSVESSQTITLPHRVLNDKMTKNGKPWGFAIGQRYVSLSNLLKGPTKTSELELR